MSRNLSSSVTSASAATQVRYRTLVEVWSVTDGPLRATTGFDYVIAGANTYSPVGNLGAVESVHEDSDPFPRVVKLRLAAITNAQMTDMLSERLFRRPVKIYRAFLNEDNTVVSTPQLLHVGYINRASLVHGPAGDGAFEVESESKLYGNGRPYYMNRETLQYTMGSSGDTFFDYANQIPTFKSSWGGGVHRLDAPGGGSPSVPNYYRGQFRDYYGKN